MAWIESHQSLGAHPKTKRLARLLGINKVQAVGHLHYLWWWSLDYAKDGGLSCFDADEIADGALWEGDPALFLSALSESGFVDETGSLNDWDDYAGKLIARREANAARMRNARAETKDDRAPHVQSTSHARVEREDQPTNQQNQQNQPTPPKVPPESKPAVVVSMNGSPPGQEPEPGGAPDFKPTYSKTLSSALTKAVGSFRALDVSLTETWFKSVLVEVERDIGPLPRDKLQDGLHVAYSGLERAVAAERSGGRRIANIRGLSRKIILDSLKEQADVHVA